MGQVTAETEVIEVGDYVREYSPGYMNEGCIGRVIEREGKTGSRLLVAFQTGDVSPFNVIQIWYSARNLILVDIAALPVDDPATPEAWTPDEKAAYWKETADLWHTDWLNEMKKTQLLRASLEDIARSEPEPGEAALMLVRVRAIAAEALKGQS